MRLPMLKRTVLFLCSIALLSSVVARELRGEDIKKTEVFARIIKVLNDTPAIDTHEHLRRFEELPGRVQTPEGSGITLHSLWSQCYYTWTNPLSPWPQDGRFETWWKEAHDDFDDARATGFYRSMLPAFQDLYGVDFDTITDEQAVELNRKIFNNYRDDRWLQEVVTKRANIELMLIDPFWNRLQFNREYPFSVPVLNVTELMRGSHPGQFPTDNDNVYLWAQKRGLPTETLDDYLAAVEALFSTAVLANTACLKSTQAYMRQIRYEKVSKERATEVFGKSPQEITREEQRDFEDFMFWEVCRLSAKYELPFQIHTGQARIQGSNPMNLVDAIEGNPNTKFILFHGGYPWVGETGVIVMRFRNVWVDACWLPTLSYTMAKRAFQEWLDAFPSDRIMWGADTVHAESIYAATKLFRQCLAEALAEKVDRGELREDQAMHIGRQVLRENALKLFPKLKSRLNRSE
jgi:predicted TIM-barrel fold metal-dependent hydrolase